MERKDQFKKGKQQTVAELRTKWRSNTVALSKEKRSQLLDSKRVRHSPAASPSHDQEETDEISLTQVDEAISKLQDKEATHSALKLLQRALAQGSLVIDHFLSQDGVLDRLVGLLSDSDPVLAIESVWCVANITAGDHEHCLRVAKAAAPYMITYLSGDNVNLKEQCAWALGNIAGDSEECRELLITQGVVAPLIQLLSSSDGACIQSAAFALSNLARGDNEKRVILLNAGVLDSLQNLLTKEASEEIVTEISWVLSYLSASSENETKMFKSGFVAKMVDLLTRYSKEEDVNNNILVTPVLRFLGNVFSGPDEISELSLKENPSMISTIVKFLDSNHRHVIKEALWLISNLAADQKVCEYIALPDILKKLVSLLSYSYEIKLEAAYCLCHIALHLQQDWSTAMLDAGTLQAFVPLLKSHDGEEIELALNYFESMFKLLNCTKQFEDAGGLLVIEPLEYHSDEQIRSHTNVILETYFYKEDDPMAE